MLAPEFLEHLEREHLAPVADTVCSQCTSKVYGAHYLSQEGELHCLGCAFCVLNGHMGGLPSGWRRVGGGGWQGPSLLEGDEFLVEDNAVGGRVRVGI